MGFSYKESMGIKKNEFGWDEETCRRLITGMVFLSVLFFEDNVIMYCVYMVGNTIIERKNRDPGGRSE